MRGYNFERRKGPFADLLRYVLQLRDRDDPPAVYAGAVETTQALPGLASANALPALLGMDAEPRIWIGNRTSISTHFDASDNIACVAAGHRRFTLFPPDQTANLYIGPLDHNVAGQPLSMVDMADPDFARFPRFRERWRRRGPRSSNRATRSTSRRSGGIRWRRARRSTCW